MLSILRAKLRKLLPTLILLALTIIAGATDWLSDSVQKSIVTTLKGYWDKFVPLIGDVLVFALFISIANLLYEPIANGVQKALDRSKASNRGKVLVARGVQLVYWGVVLFFAVSVLAPTILAKLSLSIGLFGAALALAMQGLIKEVIAGALLQFMPKFEVGDYVEVSGIAGASGRVVDIHYLSTVIESAVPGGGQVIVPNSKIWETPVLKPEAPCMPFQVGDYIEVVGVAEAKGKVVEIRYLSTTFETPSGLLNVPNSKIKDAPIRRCAPPAPPPSRIILP
ncbi:MAG TPA: mechanosensitive ion channel domain-containing protein [Candidatus Obscuribacterales bacterium]